MSKGKEKKTETVGFKTTPTIKEALEHLAEREERTTSFIINRIIENHLKKEHPGLVETPSGINYGSVHDRPYKAVADSNKKREKVVQIPIYDVKAAAGRGNLVTDENMIGYQTVMLDFVENELRISRDRLAFVTVQGDSMEPTMREGDLIMVELVPHENHTRKPGVYVFTQDGELLIKRLQFIGETISVVSDNPDYKAYKVMPSEAEIKLIGRMVWKWREVE